MLTGEPGMWPVDRLTDEDQHASSAHDFSLRPARLPQASGLPPGTMAVSTIPIGDAIIVLRSNGPKATFYGVHGATAVVLLATAVLLFT
jgi:hypothetical protein